DDDEDISVEARDPTSISNWVCEEEEPNGFVDVGVILDEAGERSMLQVKLNVRLVFCERGECLFHIRFDQVKVEKLRSKEAPVEAEPALKFMCWFSSIPVREERLEL
ncbi:hypothetical protein LINPERHAP1_LOCUS8335, partial [Linum perenne]